jgi:predicted nucleic acid-binding protein
MVYLDTSALLKLYVRESGSEAVQRLIESQEAPLPIWEIQEMELINALRLKVFWKEIEAGEAKRQMEFFDARKRRGLYYTPEVGRSELMAVFRELSAKTPELGCRTMDILHVAFALQLEPEVFVSFDMRQRKLALETGLNVPDLTIQ